MSDPTMAPSHFRIWDSRHGAWWVRGVDGGLSGYTEAEEEASLWAEPEVELMLEVTTFDSGNLRLVRVGGEAGPDASVEVCTLPDGSTLSRRGNGTGGYVYHVGEIEVWNTGLVPPDTFLAALVEECRRARMEASKG